MLDCLASLYIGAKLVGGLLYIVLVVLAAIIMIMQNLRRGEGLPDRPQPERGQGRWQADAGETLPE